MGEDIGGNKGLLLVTLNRIWQVCRAALARAVCACIEVDVVNLSTLLYDLGMWALLDALLSGIEVILWWMVLMVSCVASGEGEDFQVCLCGF